MPPEVPNAKVPNQRKPVQEVHMRHIPSGSAR